MWEPFAEDARRTIVLAQEVAQMFASNFIGSEHITFALADRDDEVGRLLAQSVDRDAIKERLGAAGRAPGPEMMFNREAKRTIELAFVNARRLDHNYIDVAHLALALRAQDPIALVHADRLEVANAFVHRQPAGEVPRPVGEVTALDRRAGAARGCAYRRKEQPSDIGA